MRRPVLRGAALITIAFALATTLEAQSSRWRAPYESALKAISARNYEQAVTQLQQAIAADPKSAPDKYVEGVFRMEYFPYYYLGVAQLELHRYDQASDSFAKARQSGLTRKLTGELDTYQKRLSTEMAAAKPAAPSPAGPSPAYTSNLAAANAAFTAQRYADAVTAFDAAKSADAAEFTKANAQARRDEAERRAGALRLVDEGRQALQRSQLAAARAAFTQAERAFPGQKAVTDGLAEIAQREETYRRSKAALEQHIGARDLDSAKRDAEQARAAHPELYAADNLDAAIANAQRARPVAAPPAAANAPVGAVASTDTDARKRDAAKQLQAALSLAAQGQYADADRGYAAVLSMDPANRDAADALEKSRRFSELRKQSADLAGRGDRAGARQRLTDARGVDSARFDREGLAELLAKLQGGEPGADPGRTALRAGLLALFQGDATRAIGILEPVSRDGAKSASSASLHAYLGVAYATKALAAASADPNGDSLRAQAMTEFRRALSEQSDYRLSSRLVSPKIVTLFEQARSK